MIRKKLNKFLAGMMMSVMLFNSAVPYYANAEGEEYISGEEKVSENEMPDTSDPEGITSEEDEDDTDDGSEREISVSEDAAEGDDEGFSIEERDIDKDEKAIEENEADNDQPETDDVGGEKLVYGDYSYSIDNEEVTITGYTGSASEVVIPATIDDYPVKKIGSSAFVFHTEITSLVLPESIEVIDINAFSDCVALSSIKFDTNLKEIGDRAFNGCIAINSIDLPEGLEKIGESAFNGSQIKYVKIPSTISSIGISSFAQSGFFGCELLETMEFAEGLKELPYGVAAGIASLIEVKLPQSVTCIKQDAFYNDTNLSIINLPDGITEIERGAFGNCKSLSSLIIPESTTKIDSYAFDGCVSLNSITLNNNLKEIGDEAFDGCTAIKSIDLPEGLEKIGKYAFSGSRIKYVKIPSTISTIGFSGGSSAFSGCDLLETIEFADGLKEVPGHAASDIPSLIEVILPQSVNHIGDFVFCDDTNLSVINLPDGITEIESCAFYNCKSLSNLILPESTTKIGRSAFGACVSLNSITFNNNLKEIENDAFSGCTAIKSIDLPEGLEKIGQNAFKGSQIRYVKIPSTITTIYEREKSDISAFSGCNLLETMEFAEGLKEVPAYAAAFIPSLIEVKLPQSVTCIKDNAFCNDGSLEVINLPDTIEEIGNGAFYECVFLDSVVFPKNTTRIGDCAFEGCCLTSVSFNSCLKTIGAQAFDRCAFIKDVELLEGLEVIGKYAFRGTQISSIKIPSTVLTCDYAFSDCQLLNNVEFADGLKEVPKYAFSEVNSLKTVKLPNNVTKINLGAFLNCVNLSEIIIPNSCTSIGYQAFKGCDALKSIKIPRSVNYIGYEAFKQNTEFTIYGYANSYAQKYANENNIPFIVLDDEEYESGEGFDLKKDGYSVLNYTKSFGYSNSYRFSLDRYQEVYGDTYTQHIYNQKAGEWMGNCFGMSASAVLFYKGRLSLYDYIPEGTTLNNRGFDGGDTEGNVVYLSLKKDSELTKLIERYQIWHGSVDYHNSVRKDYYKYKSDTDVETNMNIYSIIENTSEPLILTVAWTENGETYGHALVVDSSRDIEDLGDGWMRVYLYDPNNPFYASFGNLTPKTNYRYALSRFIELNIINGQWRMDVGVNGDGNTVQIGCDEDGNILRESYFRFADANDYPVNFDQKASFVASNGNTNISYQSGDFSVYNSDDILLYRKANGSTIYINEDIVYDGKYFGYVEGLEPGLDEGMLILPSGQYKVTIDNGMIAFGDNGDYAGVVTDNKQITITNTESNAISISSNEMASVNVVVMDSYSGVKFSSIETDLIIDKDGCDISLSDNKLDIDTNDDQKFNVDIITEDGKGEIKGVSSNEVEKIDLDDYVEEIVEYKISYDLDGGNVAGNPDSYTNDTESFTLINPTKEGYVFNGWTGANGDIPQLTVVIEKGTEGDLSFKANWGDPTKAVTGITLSETEIKLKKGDTGVLTVSVTPADAPISSLNWTVSDDSVASISVNGAEAKVYASKAGETSITVKTENGIEISCAVLVYDDEAVVVSEEMPLNPVPEIREDTTELHLIKGQKFALPDSGWTSTNKKYVTISKKNVLTAKKVTAEGIKITKDDREITIYISQPKMVKKSIKLDAGTDQSVTFDYDADNLPILWYSNAPDVATISQDGVVTAHCKGTATITAYIYGKAYTCKVKVAEPQIVQERTIHMAINKNKTVSLKGIKKPVWKAEDETVVSVKGSKFKGLKAGDTIVSTEYEGKTYQIHVYVEDLTINVTDLNVKGKDKYTAAMKTGDKIPLSYNFVEQDVVFKSSKGEVAYWDDGAIVAQMPGKAKLNAKVNGKTITINVIVAK